MERTVPRTVSEEVELYQRTYYSLLRSTGEVRVRSLEEVHAGMNSLLHAQAREPEPDMSAFIYCLLRLPACISQVRTVVLAQSKEVFSRGGYYEVNSWEEVSAPARRRRCLYNGKDTLAVYIASRSDIDDLIPILTAFQIEWNKIHQRLQRLPNSVNLQDLCDDNANTGLLAEMLGIAAEDIDRLYVIWDKDFGCQLDQIAARRCDLRIKLLSGSLSEYRRATYSWWNHIERTAPEVTDKPVYFISSNTHSTINLLTGFPLQHVNSLEKFLHRPGNAGLLREWKDIQEGRAQSSRENFLYYLYKKYSQHPEGKTLLQEQLLYEKAHGIVRIPSKRYFDVEAQVINLSSIDPAWMDPRLTDRANDGNGNFLQRSDALILNIDYPLGLAAYNILTEIADHVGSMIGVYIMGKAATLNGVIGDVMIPYVVHDEHSQNTYLFDNCLAASDVSPYLVYGSALDNQKSVSVKGTFLQNRQYMDVFYKDGYTDIEMEAGPYLSAVYEMSRPVRHPVNEIINLNGLPFDLGILHYASDTPLGKGKNLGAGSLSYSGMDSTYACMIAILRRILKLERIRLARQGITETVSAPWEDNF